MSGVYGLNKPREGDFGKNWWVNIALVAKGGQRWWSGECRMNEAVGGGQKGEGKNMGTKNER